MASVGQRHPSAQSPELVPLRSSTSARWGDAVVEWERYVEEKADEWLTFRVGRGGPNDRLEFKPYTHRWTSDYSRRQYAKMQGFVEGARAQYDDPHLVFLTLTASTVRPNGTLRPPLDHFDELLSAWDRGVRYELTHVMNADRKKDTYRSFETPGSVTDGQPNDWEYLLIREPTTDGGYAPGGYAHCHPVIVCDGKPGVERFKRVIDKHVEKCGLASPEAHAYEECVDVQALDDLVNPTAYLFKYLGKSWAADEMTDYERRFNALLKETGRRRFQPSEGAQRWMQQKTDPPEETWQFLGIADNAQVESLWRYESVGDFAIDHEMSVGAWLQGRAVRDAVRFDAEENRTEACEQHGHEWFRGKCVRCGINELDLCAGKVDDLAGS